MACDLPSNPLTINDTRPKANTWTPESVALKYSDREKTAKLVEDVNADLAELASWDNFERKTSDGREATKAALRRLIETTAIA